MNFTTKHRKSIIFLIIALLVTTLVLIYIFLKPSTSFPVNQNSNCQQTNLPYQNPTLPIDIRVADLMSRMTDEEKIGQMVLVEKNSVHNMNDITTYNLGG